MSDEKYDYLFKIILVGEVGVGKLPFILKFIDDSFTPDQMTVGK